MHSSTDPKASAPCPEPFNLAAHVLARACAHHDRIALHILHPTGAETWTYGRLSAAILGLGTSLLDRGLVPGDRVLLRLGNTVQFPLAFLACIAVGLVPVVSSPLWTVPEVEASTTDLAPRLILAGPGVALPATLPCPVLSMSEPARLSDAPPCRFAMGDPDRLAYMIFTSGTSGRPRAVMHAHRAILARAIMHRHWIGLTEDDRLLHPGAFNWTYTLGAGLLDPWTVGATAMIPAPGTEAAQLADLLHRHDATIFAATPGVYRQMLRAPLPDLPRLRHGLSAGEALPQTLRAQWETRTGRPVFEALGLSECSTFVSAGPDRPAPPGSCGYAQPGRRISVLESTGAPVPDGKAGVLALHRSDPGLFLGYFDAPDETSARHSGDWFLTGDMVRIAPDGALTYLGRSDDMMNAGGFRVSPIEVEDAMRHHPAIEDCAATEIAVKADATVIACFYTAAVPPDEAALSAHAASRLARYKQPRLFVRVTALPRGANNKLLRRVLRRQWEAAHAPT